jgi:hypothetical protein
MKMKLLIGLAMGLLGGSVAYAEDRRVEFPSDYANAFTNYLSLDRVQNPDQIIRLFANETAVAAGKRGEDLPNGSVLVGEIYAARKDGDGNVMTSSLGRRTRDKLVAIAVMEKQAGWGAQFPKELRNGDWDFAIFSPDGKPLDKDLNACRSCHAPLQETQHIFSLQHLVK